MEHNRHYLKLTKANLLVCKEMEIWKNGKLYKTKYIIAFQCLEKDQSAKIQEAAKNQLIYQNEHNNQLKFNTKN